MRERTKAIERGQSITFRFPSDTPDYLLKQLQVLKESERRNFSSRIAQFVLKGVNETFAKKREAVTIPLPKALTKEQKNWLKHEHSEALLGTILYQLLSDPVRATSLLASLNSGAPTIDEALYLQEEVEEPAVYEPISEPVQRLEPKPEPAVDPAVAAAEEKRRLAEIEASLDDLSLDNLLDDIHADADSAPEADELDPLGDFFSNMNK